MCDYKQQFFRLLDLVDGDWCEHCDQFDLEEDYACHCCGRHACKQPVQNSSRAVLCDQCEELTCASCQKQCHCDNLVCDKCVAECPRCLTLWCSICAHDCVRTK